MSDLVMLHVMLSAQEMAQIEQFRERSGKRSRKDAVRELIERGLRTARELEANSNQATARPAPAN